MKNSSTKLPNPDGIQQIRERYQKRKQERLKNYDDLAEALRRKNPIKKIAKNLPDAEL